MNENVVAAVRDTIKCQETAKYRQSSQMIHGQPVNNRVPDSAWSIRSKYHLILDDHLTNWSAAFSIYPAAPPLALRSYDACFLLQSTQSKSRSMGLRLPARCCAISVKKNHVQHAFSLPCHTESKDYVVYPSMPP